MCFLRSGRIGKGLSLPLCLLGIPSFASNCSLESTLGFTPKNTVLPGHGRLLGGYPLFVEHMLQEHASPAERSIAVETTVGAEEVIVFFGTHKDFNFLMSG